ADATHRGSRRSTYAMPLSHSMLIEVKRTKQKGRGVFARTFIPQDAIIERVPVLVIPSEDIESSDLANYAFVWGARTVAIALGFGSLYNHSYTPNARYEDENPRVKTFIALRDIQPGEEITVNYNGEPNDRTDVGFKVV